MPEPSGVLQLYSVQKQTSANVVGRNGGFALVNIPGKPAPIEVGIGAFTRVHCERASVV